WPRFTSDGGIVEIEWNQCMERRVGVKLLNINASYPDDLILLQINGHPLMRMEDALPRGEFEFYIPSAYQIEGTNQLRLILKPTLFDSPEGFQSIGLHSLRITLGAVVKNAIRIGDQVRKSLLFAAPIALKVNYPADAPHFLQFSYGLYSMRSEETKTRYQLIVSLRESESARPAFKKEIPVNHPIDSDAGWRFEKLRLPEMDRPGILEIRFESEGKSPATDYLALSEVILKPRQKNWSLRQGDSEPDIMLITLSSIGVSQLGVYGNPDARTPFLDRMSQSGYLHCDLTTASNGELSALQSIATGRYPRDHGLYRSSNHPAQQFPVIPDVLMNTIYQSHGFSYSETNDASPFIRMNGFRRVYLSDPNIEPLLRLKTQFEDAISSPYLTANPGFYWLHIAGRITSINGDTLRIDPNRYNPHPIHISELNLPVSELDRLQALTSEESPVDDVRNLLARNDQRITELDQFVSEIIRILVNRRHNRSIALIITADHGIIRSPGSNVLSTDSLSQEVIQVPLLISRVPAENQESTPRILSKPTSSLRLFDYLTGLAQSADLTQGITALSQGNTAQRIPAAPVFSEHDTRPIVAYRKANLKLIHCLSDPYFQVATTSLFDLQEDPSESSNLVGRDPATARQLMEPVMAFCRGSEAYPKPRRGLEDEVLETLKALNYTSDTKNTE
nr:sulfatase-like hydrolase/transferase [bacterium]